MKDSLKQIRNSASKKKVDKLFDRVEKEQSSLAVSDTQRSLMADDVTLLHKSTRLAVTPSSGVLY